MTETPTKPGLIRGPATVVPKGPWQNQDEQWSFGPVIPGVVADAGYSAGRVEPRALANTDQDSTIAEDGVVGAAPKRLPRRNFGKRALTSVSHWEGVVESVDQDSFRARLIPIRDGQPVPSRPEFSEFGFDELSNDEDLNLVVEGAVFYWTLGRLKNPAGTLLNVSLLRFRRLPALTEYRKTRARIETEGLLDALGVTD